MAKVTSRETEADKVRATRPTAVRNFERLGTGPPGSPLGIRYWRPVPDDEPEADTEHPDPAPLPEPGVDDVRAGRQPARPVVGMQAEGQLAPFTQVRAKYTAWPSYTPRGAYGRWSAPVCAARSGAALHCDHEPGYRRPAS
jgi:hypothetical protein